MFYWVKTSKIVKKVFKNWVWSLPNTQNKIYLTFDDGPTPEITKWVLNLLSQENIKATFFCIGKNIENHPALFNQIINQNHQIGNHTFNHVNGWGTKTKNYSENIDFCKAELQKNKYETNLFRPPYGKITLNQSKKIREIGYKIIMWDVLSADFDTTISKQKCLDNVVKNTTSGSIIVFHDSVKAEKNLKYALPKAIKQLKEKGFVFDVLC